MHPLSSREDGSSGQVVFTESNTAKLLAVETVLISMVIAVVGLRCWCRHYMLRAFQLDDACMIAALALAVTGYACFVTFTQWGGGKHYAEIPDSWHEQLNYWGFIQSPIDNTGISMVKISIAFFLKRFVQGRRMNWFLNGMIGFVVVFILATILTFVLSCEPMDARWKTVEGAVCWSGDTMSDIGVINGAISIATDIIFVAVPMHVIRGLQVNKRTRWSLMGIMSLGLFVPVATTARMVYGYLQAYETDWTYHSDLYLWLNIEVQVAILVISLPTLRPLFHTMLRGSSARTGQYYKNEYNRAPMTASRAYAARSQLRRSKYYERQEDIPLDDWERTMHLGGDPALAHGKQEAYSAQVVAVHSDSSTGRGKHALASSTFQTTEASRGSEDGILPLPPTKGIQIRKTTEVIVM